MGYAQRKRGLSSDSLLYMNRSVPSQAGHLKVDVIRVQRFTDTKAYCDMAEPFLLSTQGPKSLPLTVAEGVRDLVPGPFDVFGAVLKNEEPVLVFSQNRPQMVLAGDPAYCSYLVNHIISENLTVYGVVAERELAADFGIVWQEFTGQQSHVDEERLKFFCREQGYEPEADCLMAVFK